MVKYSYSSLLFTEPSFLDGAASVIDLGGTLTQYNESLSPDQADALAIASDWKAVGEDMRAAMNRFAAEHGLPPPRHPHR